MDVFLDIKRIRVLIFNSVTNMLAKAVVQQNNEIHRILVTHLITISSIQLEIFVIAET